MVPGLEYFFLDKNLRDQFPRRGSKYIAHSASPWGRLVFVFFVHGIDGFRSPFRVAEKLDLARRFWDSSGCGPTDFVIGSTHKTPLHERDQSRYNHNVRMRGDREFEETGTGLSQLTPRSEAFDMVLVKREKLSFKAGNLSRSVGRATPTMITEPMSKSFRSDLGRTPAASIFL